MQQSWLPVRLAIGLVSACLVLATGEAGAQSYPSQPVKLVVTIGAGSSPDVTGRIVAEHLGRLWKQQVFVANHPGAAGSIGMKVAGTSPPDGYTLLFAQSSTFVAMPEIQASFPFDLLRDFVPIGFVGEQPVAIAATPALGVNTLAELIALAKKKPGEINMAVLSRGGIAHLSAEWLKVASGTQMTSINYSNMPAGIADAIGGRVQLVVDGLPSLRGNISGGTLKLLAVGASKRLHNLPDIPVTAETLPGYVPAGFFALMAPPGTPKPIADKISADLRTVLADPALIQRFAEIGTYTRAMTPDELVAYVREQQKLWRPVIESIGMKAPEKKQ